MSKKLHIVNILKNLDKIDSNTYLKEISLNINHYETAEKQIKNKNKNWYNQRIDDHTNKDSNKWEHLTKKYLEDSKHIKTTLINPIFDKVWRSRFGEINPFESNFPTNLNKIYISDYIMFNPNCKLTFDLIDRILPYIKFKKIDKDTIQIDRWIYKTNGFFIIGSDRPNYEIKLSDVELGPDEHVKTELDKWLVVRAMLQIMNDTPDEYVNFGSYQIIGYWYNKNDSWLVSWEPNYYKDKSESEKINTDSNILDNSDLVINLDNKIEQNELIELLYEYAIYGGNDLEKTGFKYDKTMFISITRKILKDLHTKNISIENNYIENISDATINTRIDLNLLDLTKYKMANGENRTRKLIDEIKRRTKYIYNCDNVIKPDGNKITKSDLLARMYNLSLPFGMGIFSHIEKIKSDCGNNSLKAVDIDKLFENNKNEYGKTEYFDYIFGVPIKTSFDSYPIINFRQFEKYNGNGSFIKCIKSLETELEVEKHLPTRKYIDDEFERMSK